MAISLQHTFVTTLLLSSVLGLSACETTGGNNAVSKGLMGAAAGAIVGSIIGNNAGSDDAQSGALIGAIIGGAGGAYVGCREDGGCGATQNNTYQNQGYGQSSQTQQRQTQQGQNIDRRQFFDNKTGRYYYYDPVTRQEYYENGTRKYR